MSHLVDRPSMPSSRPYDMFDPKCGTIIAPLSDRSSSGGPCPNTIYLVTSSELETRPDKATLKERVLIPLSNSSRVGFAVINSASKITRFSEELLLAYPDRSGIDQVIIDFGEWNIYGLHLSEGKYLRCKELIRLLKPYTSNNCTIVFRGVFRNETLGPVQRSLSQMLPGCTYHLMSAPANDTQLQVNSEGIVFKVTRPHQSTGPTDPVEALTEDLSSLTLKAPYSPSLTWDKNLSRTKQVFKARNVRTLENFRQGRASTLVLLPSYQTPQRQKNILESTWGLIETFSEEGNVFCLVIKSENDIRRFAALMERSANVSFDQVVFDCETDDDTFLLSKSSRAKAYRFMTPEDLAGSLKDHTSPNCTFVFPNSSTTCSHYSELLKLGSGINTFVASALIDQIDFDFDPGGKVTNTIFRHRNQDVTLRVSRDPLGLKNFPADYLRNIQLDTQECLDFKVFCGRTLSRKREMVQTQFQVINAIALRNFNPNSPTTIYALSNYDDSPVPGFYHKRSFCDIWNQLQGLGEKGNALCVVASDVDEIASILLRVTTTAQITNVDQLVVCGHGTKKGSELILYSEGDRTKTLGAGNFSRKIVPFLSKRAVVVFDSCKTGCSHQNALARVLHQDHPEMRFYAPHSNCSELNLEISDAGYIVNAKFQNSDGRDVSASL